MIWARVAEMEAMHCIASVRDRVALAYCRVELVPEDVAEIDENPPHETRCDGCVRVLVNRRCIERGLTELLAAGEP
jgi:hypothetical protein